MILLLQEVIEVDKKEMKKLVLSLNEELAKTLNEEDKEKIQ